MARALRPLSGEPPATADAVLALRASEERLKEAEALARLGSWTLDLRTQALTWSDEIFRIFEIDPAGFGASYEAFLNAIHPDDRDLVNKAYADSVASHTPYSIDHRLRMADGRIKFVHEQCRTFYDADGTPVRSIGTVQDITGRKRAEEALRAASLYARSLIEASLDPLVTVSPDGKVTDVNQATEAATGVSREKLIGTDFAAYFTRPEAARAGYAQVLRDGSVRDYPLTLRHVSGLVMDVLYNATVYRDEAGAIAGVFAAARDVTERKRAEDLLREQELKFRTLFESVSDAIFIVDAATAAILDVNQSACEQFGYSREEMRALDVNVLTGGRAPYAAGDVRKVVAQAAAGQPQTLEWLGRRRGGEPFWVEVVVRSANIGGQLRVVAMARDITERRQAEAMRAQLASIVEWSRDAIIGKDLKGIITSWNSGAERMYGYAAAEIVGRPVGVLAPPEHHDEVAELIERIRQGREAKDLETVRLRKDGVPIDVSLSLSPIRDSAGNVVSISTIARDISDRKRAERALDRATRALRTLSAGNRALVHATTEGELLREMCRVPVEMGGYRLAWIGFAEQDAGRTVRPVAWNGANGDFVHGTHITWADNERGRGPVGSAIRTGRPQVVRDITADPTTGTWREAARKYGYRATLALPLLDNAVVFGAMAIYSTDRDAFDADELALLTEMAGDLAFGLKTLRARVEHDASMGRLARSMEATVRALANTVELRDPYTAGHQRRVAAIACAIARELGVPADRIVGLNLAATVHDIGKLVVPGEILAKPGLLTAIERSLVQSHAEAGYQILKGVEFPWPVAETVYQHHERLDGSGYPRGLTGRQVITEARILAVADVVEATASHRPYRAGKGLDVALGEITKGRGTLFDADAVDACLKQFRERGFRIPD